MEQQTIPASNDTIDRVPEVWCRHHLQNTKSRKGFWRFMEIRDIGFKLRYLPHTLGCFPPGARPFAIDLTRFSFWSEIVFSCPGFIWKVVRKNKRVCLDAIVIQNIFVKLKTVTARMLTSRPYHRFRYLLNLYIQE